MSKGALCTPAGFQTIYFGIFQEDLTSQVSVNKSLFYVYKVKVTILAVK